jgi:DnaJ-class molecular chaperone
MRLATTCPRCGGGAAAGLPTTEPCELCADTGEVSLKQHHEYVFDQAKRANAAPKE